MIISLSQNTAYLVNSKPYHFYLRLSTSFKLSPTGHNLPWFNTSFSCASLHLNIWAHICYSMTHNLLFYCTPEGPNVSVFQVPFEKNWWTNDSSGGGSMEGARTPPLREILIWIYLPTINHLLSIRNKSTRIHSVYPRLIVWYTFHCQQPFKCVSTSMIWARLVIGHSK